MTNVNFDDRTLAYTGGAKPTAAAAVSTGNETASMAAGQVSVLSAVNVLARAHPALVLAIPDVPLVVGSPLGGSTLLEASHLLALAAQPGIRVEEVVRVPSDVLSLGIGSDAGPSFMHAGGARWTALTGSEPLDLSPDPSSMLGAALAVSECASAIFRASIGQPVRRDRGVSLWTLDHSDGPTGPSDLYPVDVGDAWLVGAGAVGSGLAWWLWFIGVIGRWVVIDGDIVDITNLNRSLGLFIKHAGLGNTSAVSKAEAAADLICGAEPFSHWLDDWFETEPTPPDVVIPVANERGARPSIAAYGHPATIHATTSPNWTAELHRHLPSRDGCIACRLPEDAPRFACATAADGAPASAPRRTDAALPFLSGSAGLLAVAGLMQLQHSQWTSHSTNHWRLFFDDSPVAIDASRWGCEIACTTVPRAAVRRTIHAKTRWRNLDRAATE